MEIVVFVVSLGLLATAALFLLSHWPRGRKTLDEAKLSRFFHGLILFGRDGSYVHLNGPAKDDRIAFTKRAGEEPPWWLEVSIAGPSTPRTFGDDVASSLQTLSRRFDWKVLVPSGDRDQVRYSLSGSGLQDPAALEGVARLIVRCMGHPPSTRFGVDFEGPKDYEAVDQHFGFKS